MKSVTGAGGGAIVTLTYIIVELVTDVFAISNDV